MTYQPTQDELYAALSPYFLQSDPKGFLENIKLCVNHKIDIREYINDNREYDTWYSSIPLCLAYLVGDLVEPHKKDTDEFYGCLTKIDDDLGVELMRYLWLGCADLSVVDYYDVNISKYIETLETNRFLLTRRTNNKKFIDFTKNLLK